MVFEIEQDAFGQPFLKRINRKRRPDEPRGMWMEIGRINDTGIDYIIQKNQEMGHLVLVDEEGYYRILVLTD